MRPTKNHYYCFGCHHTKILFGAKREADRYLEFNADEIEDTTGRRPMRAYYCRYCGGWHVTSKPYAQSYRDFIKRFGLDMGERLFDKITSFIGVHVGIKNGLLKKVREFRHMLKFDVINETKCRNFVDEFLEVLEITIKFQLEPKTATDHILSKFSTLCSIFLNKTKIQAISA